MRKAFTCASMTTACLLVALLRIVATLFVAFGTRLPVYVLVPDDKEWQAGSGF